MYKYNNDQTDTSIIIQPETNSLTTAWLLQYSDTTHNIYNYIMVVSDIVDYIAIFAKNLSKSS